jgi:hypothetical protein
MESVPSTKLGSSLNLRIIIVVVQLTAKLKALAVGETSEC